MEDKKIKYDLSYFMLEGGATGAIRTRGKGKSGKGQFTKSFKGKKAFGIPPENEEPTNNRLNLDNGLAIAVEEGIKGWYGKLKSAELLLHREKNSAGTRAFSWGVGEGNKI
jgi:hypothetical protein